MFNVFPRSFTEGSSPPPLSGMFHKLSMVYQMTRCHVDLGMSEPHSCRKQQEFSKSIYSLKNKYLTLTNCLKNTKK